MPWGPTPGLLRKVVRAGSSDSHNYTPRPEHRETQEVLDCSELGPQCQFSEYSSGNSSLLLSLWAVSSGVGEELFQDQSSVLQAAGGPSTTVGGFFFSPWGGQCLLPCHHTTPCIQPFSPFVVGEMHFSTFTDKVIIIIFKRGFQDIGLF